MTLEWSAIREDYNKEFPAYKDLAERIEGLLKDGFNKERLHASVEGRPKDPLSLVLKAFRKHREKPDIYAEPLSVIGDKAGVRVIVDHLGARDVVRRVIESCLQVLSFEDTADRYEPDRLGYLGQHYQVRVRDADLSTREGYLRGLECEVQVHTRAQNAWSAVSHPLLYKPPGREASPQVARKVMRAVALLSLFDEEVEEARQKVMTDPSYRPAMMLNVLQELFFEWLRDEPDDELSLDVLEVVQRAYTAEEIDDFQGMLEGFVRAQREVIDGVMSNYAAANTYNPLLFQPESLAIYERLNVAPSRLKAAWIEAPLPIEPLELVGEAFALRVP